MKTNVSLACSLYQSAAATVRVRPHVLRRASFMYLITLFIIIHVIIIFFFVLFFIFFSFVRLNIFFVFCYFFLFFLYSFVHSKNVCIRVRACVPSSSLLGVCSLFKACAPFYLFFFFVFPFPFLSSAFSPLYIYLHICNSFVESARTIILYIYLRVYVTFFLRPFITMSKCV